MGLGSSERADGSDSASWAKTGAALPLPGPTCGQRYRVRLAESGAVLPLLSFCRQCALPGFLPGLHARTGCLRPPGNKLSDMADYRRCLHAYMRLVGYLTAYLHPSCKHPYRVWYGSPQLADAWPRAPLPFSPRARSGPHLPRPLYWIGSHRGRWRATEAGRPRH